MNLKDYEQEDGTYIKDGTSYDDAESLLCDLLGFCGCGLPDEALKYVYNVLNVINTLHTEVHTDKITYEVWQKNCNNIMFNEGIAYFTYYILDSKSLTEHGGSVPGWLTPLGIDILNMLKTMYDDRTLQTL